MPIKLDCPRCKQSLSVPSKKAGAYINCPRCNGRLWVPGGQSHSAPEGTSPTAPGPGGTATGVSGGAGVAGPPGTATSPPGPAGGAPPSIQPPPPAPGAPARPPTAPSMTSPTKPAPPSAPTMAMPPGLAPPSQPPGAAPPGPAPGQQPAVPLSPVSPSKGPTPPPPPSGVRSGVTPVTPLSGAPGTPPQTPPTGGPQPGTTPTAPATPRPSVAHKKVARFIKTEATQSTIQPSPDGKLPELRLRESLEADTAKDKGGSLNPLLLLGGLCLSVALSAVLVMVDVGSEDSSTRQKKAEARAYIDANYFSSDGDPNRPLEPYQICLRQAQQAHSRGERTIERKLYRRVLEMLRAERGTHQKGLTGSHERDRLLEKQISILLSE